MNDAERPYELTFEQFPDHLYVRVKAEKIDRQSALAYLREVAASCRTSDCENLILERDIPVMLSDSDLFFTTNDFLEMMRGVRVAFVNPHLTIEDEMRFAILIGTNRGAMFTVHNSLDAARAALLL
ncbi:MAG: hypothetical protein QM785_00540 [Pyrinomonadaceae bacterium]